MVRKATVLVGLLALVGAIILPATGAGAATTLEVQVGAPLFANPAANGAPADGMRFYAPPLNVHQGDTVTFAIAGFHTATMLPANTDADTWVAANAGGPGKPYSLITADPDEGATGAKFNNTAILPSSLDCGDATAPCPYDGTTVVNSGIVDANDVNGQEYKFSAQINSAVGSTTWVLCLIHLGMRLQISVVASTATATTQAEIDTYLGQKSTHDARAASRLHRSLLASTSSTPTGGVVQAFAGYDGPHFALDHFYPSKILLRKGQRVQQLRAGVRSRRGHRDHARPARGHERDDAGHGLSGWRFAGRARPRSEVRASRRRRRDRQHPRLRELRSRRGERRKYDAIHASVRKEDR
ncbi:MAG: hypothetical protein E6K10_08115 [Methanobacteriota archaeon]|nr:MAG: hypothetical protein E6K10_08115 [Euryarchaeota archaeon]